MFKEIKVDPVQLKAALDARQQIRAGFDQPTAGMAAGMTQVNMISVPKDWAYDFLLYAQRNPQSCPVLDVLEEGVYHSRLATDSDIRTDFPRYRVWKDGEMVDELTDASELYNAHPYLVTFLIGCSFSFETALQEDLSILTTLANSLSNQVYPYNSAQRLSLHLAGVFACNFTNYCYDMAKQVVDAQQVDFNLLYPLILETAKKATQNDPETMQTGPARRGDVNILDMHQRMLQDMGREDLKDAYTLLSQQIQKKHSLD